MQIDASLCAREKSFPVWQRVKKCSRGFSRRKSENKTRCTFDYTNNLAVLKVQLIAMLPQRDFCNEK
jgi:hypothetical protein